MKSDQFLNETTSGAIASVSMPLGKTQKRAESVEVKGLKPVGKKTTSKNKGPYANSIVEGIETKKVSEAELQEDDLIIIPGQKLKRRNGFVPKDQSRVDHEVEMARSDLIAAYKNAKSIFQMLKDRSEEEGIEGWVQEKLIKANDYLNAVKEYYDGKMMREMSGGVIAAGGVGESSQSWQDEFADMIGQMKKSGRLGMPKSNYNFKTPEPKSKEELMSRLKELEAEFDPAYQQSDDYSFWKKQNDIASEISSIKRQLRQQGVAEAKSPQEFMTQISKSDSSILTNKKESPYYAAGKMLSKYADKIGQDSMDFADFKQHAALLMGGPEANMKSAKQVRNLDTAASDIILDMIWEYSSTQKDADTYFKISGFKRLREGTQSITLGKGYTGRETKDGVWRVFKDGKAVAVAGPFKTREEASAWIKKQKQGVAEGLAPGQAAWKKEMMAKGAVSFKRDQHGGGAVDRIVAYDKDGKVVGGFNRKGVAEGLEDSSTQQVIIDTVEKLFYKNQINDYGSLEAVRQGIKHHFSKPGATVESAIDGILNILAKRMAKSGNYVNLSRFKEALRQGIAHQLKKQGVAEGSMTGYTIQLPSGEYVKSTRGTPIWWPTTDEAAQALQQVYYGDGARVVKVNLKRDPYAYNGHMISGDVAEGDQLDEMNPMLVRDGLQVVIDFLSQYPTATTLTAGVAGAAAGTAIIAKLVKNAWKNHKELEQLKQDVINWSSQKLHANKNVAAKGGKVAKIIQAEITRRKKDVAEGLEQEWEVSFDYGPHESERLTVKADSKEEAIAKVKEQAKKSPMFKNISINWAKPVKQGVAEGKSTYGDGKEMYVGIEAYGVRGMKSTPWRKKFKNQAAFEKWLDSTEGDVEVYGTREINLNDFPVKNPR